MAMPPKCGNATNMWQRHQNVAMPPECGNATKMWQCHQNVATPPTCSGSLTLLLVMIYDMTKAYIFVFLLYFQEFIN